MWERPKHVYRLWEKSHIDGKVNVGWREDHWWSTAGSRGDENESLQGFDPEQPSVARGKGELDYEIKAHVWMGNPKTEKLYVDSLGSSK